MVWEKTWDPFVELEKMRNRIDNMMSDMFESESATDFRTKIPAVDMWKANGNLIIQMDMPGISKDDINLMMTENSLSVSAQTKKIKEEKKEGVYRSERKWNTFKRSTALPVKINPNDIKANYNNGTLKIEAPIAEKERKKEKEIKVEVK
jgi:HSP20 family protein